MNHQTGKSASTPLYVPGDGPRDPSLSVQGGAMTRAQHVAAATRLRDDGMAVPAIADRPGVHANTV